MSMKNLLSSQEYNGYIKGEVYKRVEKSDWQGVHDFLEAEGLVVNTMKAAPAVPTQLVANFEEKYELKDKPKKPEYTKLKNKLKTIIEHILKGGNKRKNRIYVNGKFAALDDVEFYVSLDYYKEFYGLTKRVNWDDELGKDWHKDDAINIRYRKDGFIYPYHLISLHATKFNGIKINKNFIENNIEKQEKTVPKQVDSQIDLKAVVSNLQSKFDEREQVEEKEVKQEKPKQQEHQERRKVEGYKKSGVKYDKYRVKQFRCRYVCEKCETKGNHYIYPNRTEVTCHECKHDMAVHSVKDDFGTMTDEHNNFFYAGLYRPRGLETLQEAK